MTRTGFTAVELIVTIALISVVGGAIHSGLRRQQQVFRAVAQMIASRSDVRDAAEVLSSDLLSASPLDTLPFVSDSAVEFWSTIGVSVSCDSAPGFTVRLPPEQLAGGLALTTLLAPPDSSDLLIILDGDSSASDEPDRWRRHTIATVATEAAATACPESTGLTTSGDATSSARVITVHQAVSTTVKRGAAVRILRRQRYSLYRSSDSRWYLGQRRCQPLGSSGCGTIQPLSGPYAPYTTAGRSGVRLEYLDASGAVLASDAGVRAARVDVVVHARPRELRTPLLSSAEFMDSAATSIALRNRD